MGGFPESIGLSGGNSNGRGAIFCENSCPGVVALWLSNHPRLHADRFVKNGRKGEKEGMS